MGVAGTVERSGEASGGSSQNCSFQAVSLSPTGSLFPNRKVRRANPASEANLKNQI